MPAESSEELVHSGDESDNRYDHETRVKRLKNAIKRHGAVKEVDDFRDHDDVVYIDVIFDAPYIPEGFEDEHDAEIVTAWIHWPDRDWKQRINLKDYWPHQAATYIVPLEVEKRVTR